MIRPGWCRIRISFLLSLLVIFLFGPAEASAQPVFRWAGDKAGGAPFIYDNAEGTVGFEWEFVAELCKRIKRKPEFVQSKWDALFDLIERGTDADVALNGIEWDVSRGKQATIPYFVYSQRLIVRKSDDRFRSWADLKPGTNGKKPRVGVLLGSFSERFMKENFGELVEVVPTNEVDEALQMVERGERLDATVQDSPAAIYYVEGKNRPELKLVGEPRGENYYIILTREQDQALRAELNKAIRDMIEDGTLETIYRKYNLWSAAQERLAYLAVRPWPPVAADEKEEGKKERRKVWDLKNDLLKGAKYTIILAVLSMPIAILLGILIAVGRVYGNSILRFFLAAYVEILRGTPLLLQMYFFFFVAPQIVDWLGWSWLSDLVKADPLVIGVFGLAINYSACEAEIYRAGLLAIPKGQMEAALSLGMTRRTAIRRIVLPQAFRIVIPPVTNDFITLFKDTSVCSMILITELTSIYYQNKSDRMLAYELAVVIALIYLALSYPLSVLARKLEDRLRKGIN